MGAVIVASLYREVSHLQVAHAVQLTSVAGDLQAFPRRATLAQGSIEAGFFIRGEAGQGQGLSEVLAGTGIVTSLLAQSTALGQQTSIVNIGLQAITGRRYRFGQAL